MKTNKIMCLAISATLGIFSTLSTSIPVFAADASYSKEMYSVTEVNDQVVSVEKSELKFGTNDNIISEIADWEGNAVTYPVSGVTEDMKVEYSIADESVAKIDSADSTQVTILCLKEGTTTLTAKTSDGQTAEIEIIVWHVEKEEDAVPVDDDLPQTGYSNIYKVIAGLAALMTVSGATLVVKTRKENE